MKALAALALLAVATVNADNHDDGEMVCPQAGWMIPDEENLCFVHFCTAPGEPPIKRMCPKGVRVPTWWEGGLLNMCFIVNIVKHNGEPVCLRCDNYDIPPNSPRCDSDPCPEGCTCENTEYTHRCDCPNTGIVTEVDSVPMPVNHCEPDPCENGGTCQNQWDGYFCFCPNGWTGHRCETSVCDWHGCHHGGTCIIDEIGWHCECTECYTGACCENELEVCGAQTTPSAPCGPCYTGADCSTRINSCGCREEPCPDGFVCVDGDDGAKCQDCPDCMTGPDCKVRKDTCECTKTPCPENARCEDLSDVESHECICNDCWEGPTCNIRKNTCECNNPCPANAACQDDIAGPLCSCGDCMKGDLCEEEIVSCECNNPCAPGEECKMVDGEAQCVCPDCFRNAYGERGCKTPVTHLCICKPCVGDQEVCVDGDDEDGDVVCKIGNPSSGNAFTVVFEENDTEKSFKEIPLELYITGAVLNSGTRFVNIRSAGLEKRHHCYFNVNVTVPENKVERFTVERCMMQNGTGLERLAIRLTELNKDIMTVYGVNKDRWTADAFLALPDVMAGREFQTASYSPAHISSQFAIAVLYDDTEVTIKLADDNDLPPPYNKKGSVYKQTMHAFDTFQVQARCKGQRPSKKRRCHLDLTGSVITANKDIHVFSGNIRAFIPAGDAFSRDHLIEELVPRDRWGRDFGLVSIPGRAIGDLLQIMAIDMVETEVDVYISVGEETTKQTYRFPDNRKYHKTIEIPSNARIFVTSAEKLSIYQYSKSRDDWKYKNETIHDPVSITVPPIQQFTNHFFISNPMFTGGKTFNLQPYDTTFAMLVAKAGEEGAIELNGSPLSTFVTEWGPLPTGDEPDVPALVGAVIKIPVREAYATNVISNSEGNSFQCLIYGYDDRESFGMPAAMALGKITS